MPLAERFTAFVFYAEKFAYYIRISYLCIEILYIIVKSLSFFKFYRLPVMGRRFLLFNRNFAPTGLSLPDWVTIKVE